MLQTQRFSSSEESLTAQLQQVEMQINNLQEQQTQSSEENLDNTIELVTQTIAELQAEIHSLQEDIVLLTQPNMPYESTEPLIGRKILVTATPSADKRLDLVVKQDRLAELKNLLNMYQKIFVDLEISRVSSGNASDRGSEQLSAALVLYQQIYSNLLSNYEQIRLARMRSTPNIVQVEEAIPPISPIRPKPFLNIALGFSVGIVIAAGIAYLIEYLDDTLRSPDDVAYVLQLPILGYIAEIPREGKSKDNKNLPITYKQPRSPVSEAFRSLRANLEFADVDHPIKSILVTSAGSSEGKTTVAVNLSIVIAQAGNKVILLDGDLRRPRIHRFLDIPNRIGLSDLLRNHSTLQAVIQPWKEEQLSVITSGGLPPNPAEVLGSGKMAETITELKETSDMVIVDGTPSMYADASVLSTIVDAVLIVVHLNRTQASDALATLDQFNRMGARIIGVVLNHAQRKHAYYYKEYSDSHQYSYDYNPDASITDHSPS
jgi:capsular exopolysaccharide synthesis family protein